MKIKEGYCFEVSDLKLGMCDEISTNGCWH